jgi:signal peptide peptidase SppA
MDPQSSLTQPLEPRIVAIHPACASALAGFRTGEPDAPLPKGDALAVLTVRGAITKYGNAWSSDGHCCSSLGLANSIESASMDDEVAAILLVIDSPGGEVAGIEQVVTAIASARERKPVHAYIDDMAASAGYWIASQADTISANPSAMVGSIGAYAVVADVSRMLDKAGIDLHVVASAPKKGLSAGGVVTDEVLAEVQKQVDRVASRFIADVAAGRGKKQEDVEAVADGGMHPAEDALAIGLIDSIGTIGAAVRSLAGETRRAKARRTRYAAKVATAKLLAKAVLDRARN